MSLLGFATILTVKRRNPNAPIRMLAGTIDFPPPGFRRIPSPLHDERIIGWVKFFTHASLDGGGRPKFQTSVDIWLGRKVWQVASAVHKLR